MSFPSLEKSLDNVSNRYMLVVLAAKRARQLNRGAKSQVEASIASLGQNIITVFPGSMTSGGMRGG